MAVTFDEATKSYTNGVTTLELKNGAYEISTLEQLKLFRDAVNEGNSFQGQTVKLTAADGVIDLNNEEWEPIGRSGIPFKGAFDGNGVTIQNLKITKGVDNVAQNNCIGFFGLTNSPASIKNVTIENVDITGSLFVGAIVGYGYTGTELSNCHVTGKIEIEGWWYIGGIGGNGYMKKVDNCTVSGTDGSYIKGINGSYVGGIWGFRGEGAQSISNSSVSNIDISGDDRIGGICGIAHYGNTIDGCKVENSTISSAYNEGNTALIAGANLGTSQTPAILLNNTADDTTQSNLTIAGTVVENPPVLGENDHQGNPGGAAIIGDVEKNESGEIISGIISVVGTNKQEVNLDDKLPLADGMAVYPNSDGSLVVDEAGYVAAVGDVRYKSLAEALEAVQAGGTVTLLDDVALDATLEISKNVTLELAGFTVTGNVIVQGDADVTFRGGVMTAVSGNSVIDVKGSAVLNLDGMTVDGGNALNVRSSIHAVVYESVGGLHITGSEILGGTLKHDENCGSIGTNSAAHAVYAYGSSGGSISIENSTLKGGNGKTDATYTGYVSQLFVGGNVALQLGGNAAVEIKNTTIHGGDSDWYNAADAINVSNTFDGTLSISGSSKISGGNALNGTGQNWGYGGQGIYTHQTTGCTQIDIRDSEITGGDGGGSWDGSGIELNKNVSTNIENSTIASGQGAAGGNAGSISINSRVSEVDVTLKDVTLNGDGNGNDVIKGATDGIKIAGEITIAGGTLEDVTFSEIETGTVIKTAGTGAVDVSSVTGTTSVPVFNEATGEYEFEPAAVSVNGKAYRTLAEAVAAAQDGDTVTVLGNISGETVTVDKNLTIVGTRTGEEYVGVLNDVIMNAGAGVTLSVKDLKFGGNSYVSAGSAAALNVEGCYADVTPSKITGRSAFIVTGTSEVSTGLLLTVKNNTIIASKGGNQAGDAYAAAIFGWSYLADGSEISGNTFGSETVPYNFIAVKTMNAMAGAVIKVGNNTIYGSNASFDFYAFDFFQNNSRANVYTVLLDGNAVTNANAGTSENSFVFACVEANAGSFGPGHAQVLITGSNTQDGNVVALDQLDLTEGQYSYAGTGVTLDADGKITAGDFAGDLAAVLPALAADLFVTSDGVVQPIAAADVSTLYVNGEWAVTPDTVKGTILDDGKYYDINAFVSMEAATAAQTEETEIISITSGIYDGNAIQFVKGVEVASESAVFSNVWSFGVNSDTGRDFDMETAEKFTVTGDLTVGQFYAEKNANVYVKIDGNLTTVGSFGAKLATQVDVNGTVTVTPPQNGAAQVMVYGTMNVTGKLESTSGAMGAVLRVGDASYETEYGKGGTLNVSGSDASIVLRNTTGSAIPVTVSAFSSLTIADGATFINETGGLKNLGTVTVNNGTLTLSEAFENSGTLNFSNTTTDFGTVANADGGMVNFLGGNEISGTVLGGGDVNFNGILSFEEAAEGEPSVIAQKNGAAVTLKAGKDVLTGKVAAEDVNVGGMASGMVSGVEQLVLQGGSLALEDLTIHAGSSLTMDLNSSFAFSGTVAVNQAGVVVDGTTAYVYGAGSFTVDASAFTTGSYKVIDYTGTAVQDYSFVSNLGELENKLIFNNDLYITDKNAEILYVSNSYTGDAGDVTADGNILGYNAFATAKEAFSSANSSGGATIDLQDEVYTYAAPQGTGVELTNAGTYTVINGKGVLLNYELEVNPDKADGEYLLNVEDAHLTLTKLTLRANATMTVTDSRIDYNAFEGGSAYLSVYTNSVLNVSGSTIGFDPRQSKVNDPADLPDAGTGAGAYWNWAPTWNIYGTANIEDSTLFAYVGQANQAGFDVRGNGTATITGSEVSLALLNVGTSYEENKLDPAADKSNLLATLTLDGTTVRNTQYRGDYTTQNGINVGQEDGTSAGKLVIRNGSDIDFTVLTYNDAREIGLSVRNDKSSVEISDSTFKAPSITNNGTITVSGSELKADEVKNDGTILVSGTSVLNISALTGEIVLVDGATLTDSSVGGTVSAEGNVSVAGTTSVDRLVLKGVRGENSELSIGADAVVAVKQLEVGTGLQKPDLVPGDPAAREYFSKAQIDGALTVDRANQAGAIYIRPYAELVVTGTLNVKGEVHNRGSLVVDGGTMNISDWETPKLLGYTTGDSLTVTNQGSMILTGVSAVTFGEAHASKAEMGVEAQYADGMFATISAGGKFEADTLAFRNDDDVTLTVTGEGSSFKLYSASGRTVTGTYNYAVNEGAIIVAEKASFDVSGLANAEFVNSGSITLSSASAKFATLTNNGTFTVSGTSTLNIGSVNAASGDAHRIQIAAGTTLKDSVIGGDLRVLGDLTVDGELALGNGGIWCGYGSTQTTATISGGMITAKYAMFQYGTYVISADMTLDYGYLSYGGTFTVNSTIKASGQSGEPFYVRGDVTLADGGKLLIDKALWLDYEGAVLTVADGAAVEAGGLKLIADTSMNVNGGSVKVGNTLENNGTFTVSGASTLNIGKLTGNTLQVVADTTLTDSVIGGNVSVGFNAENAADTTLTLAGDTSIGTLYVGKENRTNDYKFVIAGEETTVKLGSLYSRTGSTTTISNGATLDISDYWQSKGMVTVDASTINHSGYNFYVYNNDSTDTAAIALMNGAVLNHINAYSLTLGSTTETVSGVAKGNASVTLEGGSTLNVNRLYLNATGTVEEVAGAEAKTSLTAVDSTVTARGEVGIGAGATVSLGNSAFTANTLISSGAIVMDSLSTITCAGAFTSTGTITARVDAAQSGVSFVQKLINASTLTVNDSLTVEGGREGAQLVATGNALWLDNSDKSTILINSEYAGEVGSAIAGRDGYFFGFNALTEYSTSIGADSAVEFTGGSYSFADGFSFTGREFTVSGDTSFDKVTGGAVAVTGGTLSIGTVELTADVTALSGALLAFSGSGMADLANLVLTVSDTTAMANRTKYVLATGVKDDSFAVTLNGETYELNVRKDGLLVGVENGELYVQKTDDWFNKAGDSSLTVLPANGYAFGGSDMHESAVMSVERDLNVATNGQNAGARVYGGGLLRNDALFSGTQKCEVTVTAGGVGKGVIGGNRVESGSIGGTLTSSVTIDSADGTFGFIVGGNQLTGGELNGFGGTSVTIQNGTFSMWICGGSVAGGDAAAQVMGNTNVTITGGTFNGTGVFGGGFVQENGTLNQVGNTNVTISGGTFAGNIYGGHGATNKDASPNGVLFGNTNITISGGIFNGNIYGGGFDQSKVQGDTHITFTGTAGADFSVNGIIDGDASNARYWSKGSFVTGDRYLTFDAFTGEFGATLITNIDQMEVTGGSDVNLKNQLDLSEVSQWEFDFGSSLEGFAQNDLAGDTLVLSGWEDQLGDEGWTVMSGSSITGFGEMEVTNGSNLIFAWNADEQYYLGSIGDEQFKLSMEDGAMKLAKLA